MPEVKLDLPRKTSPGAMLYRRIEIFPGVFNKREGEEARRFDELVTRVLVECHHAMKDYTTPKDAEYVSFKEPYSGDLSRLSCRAGSYFTPCGVQPKPTLEYLESTSPDRFQYNLLARLVSWASAVREPCSIELNNVSTYGFPSWTRDSQIKRKLFDLTLRNPEGLIKAWERKDLVAMYENFAIVHAYHQTYRIQPDTSEIEVLAKTFRRIKSKERKVETFEGEQVVANKRLDYSILEAERVRLATALGGGANQVPRMVERLISNYQDRGESVFKHRGGPHVVTKLRGCVDAIAVDFSSFDQSIQRWAIDCIIENMGLTPFAASMCRMSLYGAICVFGDSVKTKGEREMRGNPFSWKELHSHPKIAGLPSGHGWVSFIGKMVGFHQVIMALIEAGLLPKDERAIYFHVGAILLGEHPDLVVLNQGDDNLVGFASREKASVFSKWLKEKASDSKALMVKMSIEKPVMFLGTYYFPRDNGEWDYMPRIESLLVNAFVPERSIGGRFRPMWGIGAKTERDVYGRNPMYDLIAPIRTRIYREVYRLDYESIVNAAYSAAIRKLDVPNLGFTDLNEDERAFIENPDRRFYGRVDETNIRPEILNWLLQMLPAEAWAHMEPYLYDTSATHYEFPSLEEIHAFFNM